MAKKATKKKTKKVEVTGSATDPKVLAKELKEFEANQPKPNETQEDILAAMKK